MKNSIFKLCLLFSFVLFIGASAFAQSDEQLKQKIQTINKDIAKAMIEGNYSASLSYYAPDAISMPNNSKMLEGIDAIKKSNESMMQSGAKFKSFETLTSSLKTCGNMVTEIGTYKMSMAIPGMPNDYEDHGKYLTLWEKQADGSLKIKVEMWNTDVSQMGGQM